MMDGSRKSRVADLDRSDEIRWRISAAERDALRPIGDRMQSEASRLVEWAEKTMRLHPTTVEMPYEVQMAVLGVKGAIEDWTDARRINYPNRIKQEMDRDA